jgi:hypothetical protein
MSIKNVVLIAGVHGVSGRTAAEHWISIPGTRVYGLSRRVTPLPPGVEAVNADLFDREDVERKLGQISGITHIVFGAYVGKPTASERSEGSARRIPRLHRYRRNVFEVFCRSSPDAGDPVKKQFGCINRVTNHEPRIREQNRAIAEALGDIAT